MGLFPSAIISMEGEVENWLEDNSALEVEQRFREELKKSRAKGPSESNQIPGPHRSEFNCLHSSNKMEASLCSTGEQKSSSSFNYAFSRNFAKKRVWKRTNFTT